jgi:Yip1 domain
MKALFEIFYQPGKVFAALPERKGAWVAPMIAIALLVLLVSNLVPSYVGRENVARQQMEGFSSRMTPEQMQAAVAAANSPQRIYAGYVVAMIGTALMLLIISGALMAFAMMTSRAPGFATVLSMVSLAMFPYWLVSTAMTALILIASPDPASLDIRNLIATNVAAYMDKNSMAKGLYSLLSSIDILSFGEIWLLALGFSKITRTNLFFGFAAVGGLWILYVSAKMALSLLF